MITTKNTKCPKCNGKLKYYDKVQRIIRAKGGHARWIDIRRFRCIKCHSIHREIPDSIFPYKQYEAEIIQGVLDGHITPFQLEYEDYPCEKTMERWLDSHTQKLQPPL